MYLLGGVGIIGGNRDFNTDFCILDMVLLIVNV